MNRDELKLRVTAAIHETWPAFERDHPALAQVIDQANRIIRQIAESEKYDIIFQEAAYANPRIDITDKVIKALDSSKPAAK